jgi:LmbE family N-acetylglucosaminyl deacetylase
MFRLFRSMCSASFSAKKRHLAVLCGSTFALAILPAVIFQCILYRQNLAMARETYPKAASLQGHDRLLVVSPHCDDETLGAGGALAQAQQIGAAARVVFLTNGDGSRSTQVYAEAREFEADVKSWTKPTTWSALLASHEAKNPHGVTKIPQKNLFQRIATMRQNEALRACGVLGVAARDVTFLGYPDGGLRAMWEANWSPRQPYFSAYTQTSKSPYVNSFTPQAKYCGAQVVADLEKIIRMWRPTVILTTHPEDTHPDHWSAYSYTQAALEILRQSEDAQIRMLARRVRLRTFLVHHGTWPVPHGYFPNAELAPPASLKGSGTRWLIEPLSKYARATKNNALECYVSQLVFTPRYLRSFVRKNELFGEVPLQTLNPHSSIRDSKLLLKDAPSDSLWRERWPSADVHSMEAEWAERGVLALRVDLGRAPSSRVRYRLVLHALNGRGVRAFGIEARPQKGVLQASLHALDTNALTPLAGKLTMSGFEVEIPLRILRSGNGQAMTLLVSANTHAGRARLDQTATATLRLKAIS